ncbi:hypothetical protein L7F22_029502 [Adiantum nelumboides]|nr:hypothetical protein [Adiantum nelumboides]
MTKVLKTLEVLQVNKRPTKEEASPIGRQQLAHGLELELPATWAGRIWGRIGCNFSKPIDGTYNCLIGDCGVGSMQCDWAGGVPPVTVFYLNLAGSYNGDQDIYDVSLVDGYNLPMVALSAHGSSGACPPGATPRLIASAMPTTMPSTII